MAKEKNDLYEMIVECCGYALGALFVAAIWWATWTWGGIGAKYFDFLPSVYQAIPYWDCFGLLVIVHVAGGIIRQLVPKIVSIDNSSISTNRGRFEEGLGAGVLR